MVCAMLMFGPEASRRSGQKLSRAEGGDAGGGQNSKGVSGPEPRVLRVQSMRCEEYVVASGSMGKLAGEHREERQR